MFVISRNSLYRGSLYRGSIPYILLEFWPGRRVSFVISRTLLNRGLLNRGSTVTPVTAFEFMESHNRTAYCVTGKSECVTHTHLHPQILYCVTHVFL